MKKLIYYYTHKESLGHTTRVLSIIEGLHTKYGKEMELYLFQGGRPQEYLKIPENVKVFNLPSPYQSKAGFKVDTLMLGPLASKIRAEYMLKKIRQIKPDIFITEFFPFGRYFSRHELLPVLTYLKSKKARILSSIGYPYITLDNYKILSSYINFYEKLLIHVPKGTEYRYFLKNIESPVLKGLFKDFFNAYKNKIVYTGYILPYTVKNIVAPEVIRKKFNCLNKTMVLVNRGGGVIYPKIIACAIVSKKYLSKDFVFVVIPGPATTDAEMALFKTLAKKQKNGCFLIRQTPDLSSLINACDISVNMAGYNTSVQLLYFNKNTLFIPSIVHPEKGKGYCSEQLCRSQFLKKYLNTSTIDYTQLSAKKIAKGIEKIQTHYTQRQPIKTNWFSGLDKTVEEIAGRN